MEDFGRRLQKALDHADMKPAELSRRTGIGKSSISTYLAGGYHPKQDNIYKMADALNVNPEWLNGRAEDMESTPPRYSLISAKNKAKTWFLFCKSDAKMHQFQRICIKK